VARFLGDQIEDDELQIAMGEEAAEPATAAAMQSVVKAMKAAVTAHMAMTMAVPMVVIEVVVGMAMKETHYRALSSMFRYNEI
jgi:hypothetical protein